LKDGKKEEAEMGPVSQIMYNMEILARIANFRWL